MRGHGSAGSSPKNQPKYRKLFESMKADILAGRFQPGQRLPSEAALVQKSGTSRITVGRAIRELQNLGLVERVAGSGTFVRRATPDQPKLYLFGLLIPDLGETEIFEPICQSIANSPDAGDHALLWGHADANVSKTEQAWRLCQQCISRKVSGVFFAPLEFESGAEKINRRIISALHEAGIAVVLLDRRSSGLLDRRRCDLVGLNNRQAGYTATEHLVNLGCRRVAFMSYHGALSTITERMSGYEDALRNHGLRPVGGGSETHLHLLGEMSQSARLLHAAEAFVCVNDRVAGQLMQTFLARGVKVPDEIRVVGIDDVPYASLLPVPLTTVRQPTRDIGEAALRVMLERIRTPHQSSREVLLDGQLVIRKSCGAL